MYSIALRKPERYKIQNTKMILHKQKHQKIETHQSHKEQQCINLNETKYYVEECLFRKQQFMHIIFQIKQINLSNKHCLFRSSLNFNFGLYIRKDYTIRSKLYHL